MSDGEVKGDLFDSLNAYSGMSVLQADTPEALTILINSIRTPIKIWAFDSNKSRYFAYISGPLIVKKRKKNNSVIPKNLNKPKGNKDG